MQCSLLNHISIISLFFFSILNSLGSDGRSQYLGFTKCIHLVQQPIERILTKLHSNKRTKALFCQPSHHWTTLCKPYHHCFCLCELNVCLILTKCVLLEVLFYNFGTANTRWQHRTAASLGLSKKKRKPAWLLTSVHRTSVMSNRCAFVNCPRTFSFSLRLVAILAYSVFFSRNCEHL